MTNRVANKITTFLTTYTCKGIPLLAIDHEQQHGGAAFDFFLILGTKIHRKFQKKSKQKKMSEIFLNFFQDLYCWDFRLY